MDQRLGFVHCCLCLLQSCLALGSTAKPGVMNQGGVPYSISNPPGSTANWAGTPGQYSTNFNNNVKGPVEHFDVYGEVRTQYSQVYWTRNTPINLPPELVARFAGKVMAITGYEIDQVTHDGPQPGSTTKGSTLGGFSCYPECSGKDTSVPIYNAYNHHYFSWLKGKDAEVYDRETPIHIPNPSTTGVRDRLNTTHGFPTNIIFKENPGGEFRKSYHGYPSGYAQLVHSPDQWIVEPMQIDTHHRNYDINEEAGYQPWFLPKQQQNNMTMLEGGLSPLIECPCSDRITRKTVSAPVILTSGTCATAGITTEAGCTAAIQEIASVSASVTVSNATQPAGCIMVPDEKVAGHYQAVFNSAPSSHSCAMDGAAAGAKSLQGESNLGGLVNLTVSHDSKTVTITMSGPDGVWYGVGFNAEAMQDRPYYHPYAIIVDGTGSVSERQLANHGPGTLLRPSVKVVSSSVSAGIRTVLLTRSVAGATANHYSFPTAPGSINLITAVGNTPKLAYHKARSGGFLNLVPTEASSCICQPKTKTWMSYMNLSTQEFDGYNCLGEPRSSMLHHGDGTGRNVSNAACHGATYHGGLQCCKHTWFLTDLEQSKQIPNKTDTYFLKWRYYFQEYVPATPAAPASHLHLHHWVFLIDAIVNDYEEGNAHYGSDSIGKIEAYLTAQEMGLEDVPPSFKSIKPLVITPHMHAPSAIREELWNLDTGEILCNVTAQYGNLKYGSRNQIFNEADYIAIPPCIFGEQPGLQKPFELLPTTKLRAVKYFNNTYRHLGQMAQWTGMMVYDTDPYFIV